MEKDNIKGCFVSSVLLSQNQWDKKQFIHDFEEDWGIVLTDDDDNGEVLVWGIERSVFFNGREKWAKGFENQRV